MTITAQDLWNEYREGVGFACPETVAELGADERRGWDRIAEAMNRRHLSKHPSSVTINGTTLTEEDLRETLAVLEQRSARHAIRAVERNHDFFWQWLIDGNVVAEGQQPHDGAKDAVLAAEEILPPAQLVGGIRLMATLRA